MRESGKRDGGQAGMKNEGLSDIEKFADSCNRYVAYFTERPHYFRFFFFYPLGPPKSEEPDHTREASFREDFAESFSFLSDQWGLSDNDVETVSRMVIYSIHGLLTTIISGIDETSISAAKQFTNNMLFFLEKQCFKKGKRNEDAKRGKNEIA